MQTQVSGCLLQTVQTWANAGVGQTVANVLDFVVAVITITNQYGVLCVCVLACVRACVCACVRVCVYV